MHKTIPEYFTYLTWYDLDTPLGLYNFIQEMKMDGIDLNDYPDIRVYYDILYNNAFKENSNEVTVQYVIDRLKKALIKYKFAHTSAKVNYSVYYYWYEKGE